MFSTIPLIAQVVRDESELAAKPYYTDSQAMRSVNGKMETMYGQETACVTALTGVCRGGLTWADLSRTAWAAFGTHLRVQVIDQDGNLSDITPVIARDRLSSAFSITNGSAVITVSDGTNTAVASQKVNFTASSAGNVLISGDYTVSSVNSSSSYTIIATSTANQSTVGVGGATVDVSYSMQPGNQSNLGGFGYGTGGYGSGGYGAPGSGQTLDARTVTFDQWGQNLIINPNWGGIYEWAPHVSASETVSAGDFSSTSTWVLGSGWSIAAGTSSASAGGALSQPLTLTRSAWHLLAFDVVRNSGSVQPLIGGSTITAAITTSGHKNITFFSPVTTSQTLAFDGGGSFNGNIDNVSLKVLTVGNEIPNSPSSCGSIFVTAERNLVACGCTDPNTGALDPMHLNWSAAENNQDWTASAANVAGGYTLSQGSRILRGIVGNKENLIFTDDAVYRMRSVPDPSVVYAFDLLGTGCGLIGPNAVANADGNIFWVSPQSQFYLYSAGVISQLANPSGRDFNDNLSDVQGQKIYASGYATKSEIWFYYPDMRDGIECSRYHVYNYLTQQWVSNSAPGTMARTTYLDAAYFPFPLSVDPNGVIYFQEKGFDNDGSARSTALETAYFNMGDGEGEDFATVLGVRPDFDNLQGGAQITFTSKLYPQDPTPRSYGPYNITAATQRLSVRIKGRQIKYKITTNDSPTFYRVGDMTFDLKPSGQKR